jgi:hypothetical protein
MIISLYAHGMSVRDILHHLKQVYGTELSHEQVSRITDQVLEEVKAWQNRAPQGHQGPRPLPRRRRRRQAPVAGHHQHRRQTRLRAGRPQGRNRQTRR